MFVPMNVVPRTKAYSTPRGPQVKVRHLKAAVFWMEDTTWPSGSWAATWVDKSSRWEITKKAYAIWRIKRMSKSWTKPLPRVPDFIKAEIDRKLHRLTCQPKCKSCDLPREFCLLEGVIQVNED